MKSFTIRLFVLGFVSISILGFSNQVTPPADESAQLAPSTWQGFAPLGRGIASVEFPMLTYEQIRKMPAKDVYRYYHKLHLLMAELEKFQRLDKKSDKFSRLMHHLLINSSDANTETFPPYKAGNDCLIGGYWGKWTYRKDIPGIANKNGMTCISEHRCELPGDTAGGYSSGHKCNPKYFTYENASTRNEWCVNLKKDLTSNGCIALLEKRYNEMCDQDKSQGCRPFADHFKRSVLQAIAADAKYQGITEAEAVNQYRNEVFTEFERIRNYCGDTKEEWDRHSAGQQYSCFRLMSHYQQLQDTVDEIAPEPLPAPVPVQPAQNADGLGPYACIKSGLDQEGYPGASNKHIAMFAVRAKDQSDGIFLISQLSGKKARRRTTMENTILSIASVGVCKGPSLSADEARKTSDWLNKNRLNDLNDSEYARVFGEDKIHVIPRGGWRNVTFKKRRSMWDSKVENPAVRSCPQKPSESDSVRLCQIMSRACGINEDICSNKPPKERESDGDDNHRGGGSTTGVGTTTGATGSGESGPGNNADSYRADRGGGHGGPGGPGEN